MPNLPKAAAGGGGRGAVPAGGDLSDSGLDRADYRPPGHTRGYTSSLEELQERAKLLSSHRAVFNNVVHDALAVEAAEKRVDRHEAAMASQTKQQKREEDDVPIGPTFKQQASQSRYTNAEIPGYAFESPKHPNDWRAVHGVGVPAQKLVQRPRPRRETFPKRVQNVPTPMRTYTDGPRELGNKVRGRAEDVGRFCCARVAC